MKGRIPEFQKVFCVSILTLVFLFLLAPVQARADIIAISGMANIFGAGHATAPSPGGGGGGVLPPSVTFVPGLSRILTFSSVTGTVSCCGGFGPNGPDGGTTAGGSTNISSLNGISGIVHDNRTMFLAGVFLNATEPSGAGPARLLFSNPEDFVDLFPVLGQTFFIGDGLTDTGALVQQFHAPTDASRLFLGFIDAAGFNNSPGYYDDNTGSLTATLSITSPVPESPTVTLLGLGLVGIIGTILRERQQRKKEPVTN